MTTTKFDNLDELRRLYEKQKGIRINQLEIADGAFYYDVDVDTSSQDSSFSTFSAITWTVVLPGMPSNHNAGQVDGNTLTWNLTPRSGTINLRAESPARGPNSTLPFLIGSAVLLGACGVVALGGMMAFFRSRWSRKPPTPAPAG